jgi:hypothetical protein
VSAVEEKSAEAIGNKGVEYKEGLKGRCAGEVLARCRWIAVNTRNDSMRVKIT